MRKWMNYRQAYTPRAWPMLGGTFVVNLVWIYLFLRAFDAHWTAILACTIAAVVLGVGVVQLRWTIWRRRHPVISMDEYIEKVIRPRQEAAPWN